MNIRKFLLSKEFLLSMSSGFIAAALALVGDYFIGYRLVEKPRTAMDQEKHQLDLIKKISELAPMTRPTCSMALDKDHPTAHVSCSVENQGKQPVEVSFPEIDIVIVSKTYERFTVSEGRGFSVEFVDGKRVDTVIEPNHTMLFRFDVIRPEKATKSEDSRQFGRDEVSVRVGIASKTIGVERDDFLKRFPNLDAEIKNSVTRKSYQPVRFPEKVQ